MTDAPDGRWFDADALFREALERPAPDRADFVERACVDDPELRDAVLELLRVESESAAFLARPVDSLTDVPWDEVLAEATRMTTATSPTSGAHDRSGETIGAYRLVRKLGRGGMGTVYLAERADGLWEQRVALKLIRPGLDTTDVIRRFLSERQILSSLNHPNIARLLDGGTTGEGLPYLVMEYVEGTPITEYCDERRASVAERLELFCDVARAVQHAHRSLVIHRDLKPSNILVTDEGRVKLLDFGIAKLLDQAEQEPPATRTGRHPLTPEYASPEQVSGGAITTASDVFQLGLILCELVSGQRPYPTRRLLSPARLTAFLERVEPARPSSLVTAEAAESRSARPEHLARRLRGDLDAIVVRAIPKEPERRYASAEALLTDVERHLRDLPIDARPATVAYRTRKLLRRQRWLLPAVIATLLVVTGYMLTLVRYSSRLEQERNAARRDAERAEEVRRVLIDVFRSADPYAADGPDDRVVTLSETLARGADRVRSELDGRPEIQGAVLSAIADVYTNLDLVESARELREEALALRRRVHGPRSSQVARELRKLGSLMAVEERSDSAQALLTRSLEITRAAPGAADTAVAGVLTDLGDLASRRGRHAEAEEHLTAVVELLRDDEPLPAAHLAAAYTVLTGVYLVDGRTGEARNAAEEAVRLSRMAYGTEHPRTAIALYEFADLHDWDGRRRDAVPAYREAIDILDRTLGPEHERTLEARGNLAVTLLNLGDVEAAEAVHRDILAVWRRKEGNRGRGVANALQNLAVVLYERGGLAEAERRLEQARDVYDRVLDAGHYVRSFPRLTLAAVRIDRGEFAAAERAARQAARILESSSSRPSYVTATATCRVGRALMGQGRHSEARPLLESSVETLTHAARPSPRYLIECGRALARLYEDQGQPDLAERQRAEIQDLDAAAANR